MNTLRILSLAAAGFAAMLAGAQAQDRQVTIYNGPVAVELLASILRGSAPATAATAEAPAGRKVRIIMASPYGN